MSFGLRANYNATKQTLSFALNGREIPFFKVTNVHFEDGVIYYHSGEDNTDQKIDKVASLRVSV